MKKYFWELLGEAFGLGLSVVGSVVAGAFFGWLVDEKIFKGKTSPWFLILGLILGMGGGIKNIYYYQKRKIKEV